MLTHSGCVSATTAKLVVLVLVLAATSAQLLTVRQSRIKAASQLTASVLRRAQLDRSVLAVRLEIARRTTPQHIAALFRLEIDNPLTHIPMEWAPPPLLPLFSAADQITPVLP